MNSSTFLINLQRAHLETTCLYTERYCSLLTCNFTLNYSGNANFLTIFPRGMRVRQLETLVHITHYQFLFHCFTRSPVYFSVTLFCSRMPEAVSTIHNTPTTSEVWPRLPCSMWKFFQPSRQDTPTEGIHFMQFDLFILPPPSSFPPLTTLSQETPQRTWAPPRSDLLWMPSDESGIFLQTQIESRMIQRKRDGVTFLCTCAWAWETLQAGRGQPALLLSRCYTPRASSNASRYDAHRSNSKKKMCSVGCQCVKERNNSNSESCRNPDREYSAM